MKKIRFLSLLLFASISFLANAQTGFDLWVVDTEGSGAKLKILNSTAKPLTNRPEYDNQPSFINDSELVFSAADPKGNHDIILYSFRTNNFTNLSKTSDRSEFSPTITDCKQYISAVVMEADSTQRLWLYPISGEPAELLYDDIAPVGYYDWYDNKAAMFILGKTNNLVYAHGKGNIQEIAQNIGRTVKRRPKTAEILYLDRNSIQSTSEGDLVAIKSFDLKKNSVRELGSTLPGSQDLIWIDKNHLLTAKGNELFVKKAQDSTWTSLGKIESTTHQNITRMAYSPELGKLVLVMQRK